MGRRRGAAWPGHLDWNPWPRRAHAGSCHRSRLGPKTSCAAMSFPVVLLRRFHLPVKLCLAALSAGAARLCPEWAGDTGTGPGTPGRDWGQCFFQHACSCATPVTGCQRHPSPSQATSFPLRTGKTSQETPGRTGAPFSAPCPEPLAVLPGRQGALRRQRGQPSRVFQESIKLYPDYLISNCSIGGKRTLISTDQFATRNPACLRFGRPLLRVCFIYALVVVCIHLSASATSKCLSPR